MGQALRLLATVPEVLRVCLIYSRSVPLELIFRFYFRYFAAYEVTKKFLTPAGSSDLNLGAVILAGGTAGVAMWAIAIPPDVRIENNYDIFALSRGISFPVVIHFIKFYLLLLFFFLFFLSSISWY